MPHKRPGIDWLQFPTFAQRKIPIHLFSFQTDKYSAIAQTNRIYNITIREFRTDISVRKIGEVLGVTLMKVSLPLSFLIEFVWSPFYFSL